MMRARRSITDRLVPCGVAAVFWLFGASGVDHSQAADAPSLFHPPSETRPSETRPSEIRATATTTDGRAYTGAIDARTTSKTLWLRQTRGGISLSHGLDWKRIAGLRVGGKTLSGPAARQAALKLKARRVVGYLDLPRGRTTAIPDGSVPGRRLPRPRSLEIDARPMNWDADVETDGLEVRIAPRDAQGRLLQLDGTVRVQLLGQRLGRRRGTKQTGVLTEWSGRLRAGQFGPQGAVLRFPYRAVHPEFQLDIASDAIVQVRLQTRRSGPLYASAPVLLRSFNPLRDRLQLKSGTRFFPAERTDHSPR